MRPAHTLKKIALVSLLLPALGGCGVKGPPVNPDGQSWGPSSYSILVPPKDVVIRTEPGERIDTSGNPLLEYAFFFQGI